MNVILPEKERISKKRMSLYTICIISCILAIIIVIGIEILGNDIIDNFFGINKITKRTEQEEAQLKANFEDIFDNTLENKGNNIIQKIEEEKDIVYTSYQNEQKTENKELKINLPYINIKNEEIERFNEEISNTFKSKAEEVTNNIEGNIIYTVKYKAYIENNILSVIIYSDLKQEASAQRIIIQTLNFDLKENKLLKLEDVLETYELEKNEVQNKIDKDIKEEQRKIEELINLGYNMFSRDLKSDIYKIENITEYFIYNNNIYIIFPYGNNQLTTEMDLVII